MSRPRLIWDWEFWLTSSFSIFRAFRSAHFLSTSESSETLEKVSVSTSFPQSRWVSVSTSTKTPSLGWVSVSTSSKFHGLDESRSRHLSNLPVSMSLGLDTFKMSAGVWQRSRQNHILGHFWSKNGPKSLGLDNFYQYRLKLQSRSWIWDFGYKSLGLGLEFETLEIAVSVSVSNLRL